MPNYLTIDTGTTNTRIALVTNNTIVDIVKFPVGAKNGIDDKALLIQTIKQGISSILVKNHMVEDQIERILASGMITSEFGLVELPHIPAPAGIADLHNALYETVLAEISPIPFVFVRGVKINCESLEDYDMMRGEETELAGILQGEGLYILPGSHSKVIGVGEDGKIHQMKTMLTGEMIAALCKNTILKDAVSMEQSQLDNAYLVKGFQFCKEQGINQALFKVRILKNAFHKNASQIYSFFMGAVLCGEIQWILAQNPKRIVLGGKKQLKEATAILLEQLSSAQIALISDNEVDHSAIWGIIKIYEYL